MCWSKTAPSWCWAVCCRLGHLFKAETRSRKKTNLMVFLRPVVVRDGAAAEALSMGRYEQMRTSQLASQPSGNGNPTAPGAAVLPALPTSSAAPGPDTAPVQKP